MTHTEFKKKLLKLSRDIAQTYSPGTLKTNVRMDLVRNGNSTGIITVESHNSAGLGDGRMMQVKFNSDTWLQDYHQAKYDLFMAWQPTLSAFK